jgi:leucyl aminopeptidase
MKITIATQSLEQVQADLLAVAVTSENQADVLASLDLAFDGLLLSTMESDEFKAKSGASISYPTFGKIAAGKLMIVGLGSGDTVGISQAAGAAGKAARDAGAKIVGLAMGNLDAAGTQTAVEAFTAGNYKFDKYKTGDGQKAQSSELLLLNAASETGIKRGQAVAGGQALARDLVNEPGDAIYPESLADVARSLANDHLTVDVWDEVKIEAEGMGGIMGVGRGSDRQPRFIHMKYTPSGIPTRKIALVGKGVTFDSGGYSLKPSAGMQTMRCDMAGSAAVIGAMLAIRDLEPDVEVHGIVGAAENMISGNAYKLGDILEMYSGKKVEIHNTDAEGRLVLADCLHFASQLGVDSIVDLATLTGAAVVALGDHYVAMFTKDGELRQALSDSADKAAENVWPMPMPEDYKSMLKAEWGDIKNVGGRAGGSITAALFLSEFVSCDSWCHLDIAGPAFLDKGHKHLAPGGTGSMVPTLARWIAG